MLKLPIWEQNWTTWNSSYKERLLMLEINYKLLNIEGQETSSFISLLGLFNNTLSPVWIMSLTDKIVKNATTTQQSVWICVCVTVGILYKCLRVIFYKWTVWQPTCKTEMLIDVKLEHC